MAINTTMYIKFDILDKLQEIATAYNISKNKLITLIILKTMRYKKDKARFFKPVKYQKKNTLIKGHRQHVSFKEDVYEIALDLRKILKRSVSRIIAEGVEEYLGEIIKDLCRKNKKNRDKYLYNYILALKKYKNIHHLTIFWDNPQRK